MRWKYFCGASIVVGAALLKAGAPLITVIAGITLAAFFNFLRQRGNSARTGSSNGTERDVRGRGRVQRPPNGDASASQMLKVANAR